MMPKPLLRKGFLLFIAFGLIALALYLYYLVGVVDIALAIQKVDFFYYALAFIAYLASVLFFSLT
jgi:hypothetical protein